MEMEGEKRKSPQEIEDEIESTPTVTFDPFAVLPKEVYVMIFERVKDPVDKQNFMNAHIKWYNLFKSQRTSFLFQRSIVDRLSKTLIQREDGYPGFFKEKDYLNLRLVCSDWKEGIKNFVQLHPSHYECGSSLIPERYYAPHCWKVSRREVVNDINKLEQADESFSNCPPTLFAEVRIVDGHLDCPCCIPHPISRERFWWTLVDSFLEMHGAQITSCIFDFRYRMTPEIYDQARKWLGFMPNLRILNVMYFETHVEVEGRAAQDLKTYADLHPIPEMDKLLFIKGLNFPPQLFNAVVKKARNIEKVKLEIWTGKNLHLRDYQLNELPLGNLKEALFAPKGVDDFTFLANLTPFPNLKKVVILNALEKTPPRPNSPIRDKNFQRDDADITEDWPEWRTVFDILPNKFPAIEELGLHLPMALTPEHQKDAVDQSLRCRLDLPKLKRLKVHLPILSSIDFLLPLEKLQMLNIVATHKDCDSPEWNQLGGDEIIKFNQYSSDKRAANVRERFTNLKKFQDLQIKMNCVSRGKCTKIPAMERKAGRPRARAGLSLSDYRRMNISL